MYTNGDDNKLLQLLLSLKVILYLQKISYLLNRYNIVISLINIIKKKNEIFEIYHTIITV